MVTLVTPWFVKNAFAAMSVTGRPLIVPGMTTDLGGPTYPVMVIAPLLVE